MNELLTRLQSKLRPLAQTNHLLTGEFSHYWKGSTSTWLLPVELKANGFWRMMHRCWMLQLSGACYFTSQLSWIFPLSKKWNKKKLDIPTIICKDWMGIWRGCPLLVCGFLNRSDFFCLVSKIFIWDCCPFFGLFWLQNSIIFEIIVPQCRPMRVMIDKYACEVSFKLKWVLC